MKITDVKLSDPVYILVDRPGADATVYSPVVYTPTFLQIFTDEGITGIGNTAKYNHDQTN